MPRFGTTGGGSTPRFPGFRFEARARRARVRRGLAAVRNPARAERGDGYLESRCSPGRLLIGRCPAFGSSQSFMKILRLLFCSAALLCRSGALAARKVTSAIVTGRDGQDPHLDIVSGAAPAPGANAWASYAATYSSIGWDVLNVTTSATGPAGESDDMYAAGYLEGYLTQKAIYTSYQNSALTQQL